MYMYYNVCIVKERGKGKKRLWKRHSVSQSKIFGGNNMMNTKYIKNVTTLEELKKAYKKLALRCHPDCGGTDEAMAELNNEYDELFEKFKNTHKNKDGEYYEKETQETASEWKDTINKLLALHMQNVLIEVVGSFLWVSGETKPYKDDLKEIGMKWARKKQCWYLSPKGYKRFGKKEYKMDEIRSMYGSRRVKQRNRNAIEA